MEEDRLERIKKNFIGSLSNSRMDYQPYKHWLVADVFPETDIEELIKLPLALADMDYSVGKRETNNDKRGYFDSERMHDYPVCGLIAAALQSPEVVRTIENCCGTELEGTYLRIEYAQDSDGFWLAPHTDIGVKKFTMLIYLSRDRDAINWGTTLYKNPDTVWGEAPYRSNHALVFVPAGNTWHGYRQRAMVGVRKSLIVNYVTDEWRARHELAYPDRPVSSQDN